MDSDQIDFNSHINKYTINLNKLIKINNIDINLDLTCYDNVNLVDIIKEWQTLFGIIGKPNLFKKNNVIKVLYCLLTDCCTINNINGIKMDLDFYDFNLNRFLRFNVLDEKNRNIKLRIFTVCNILIVIDCRNMNQYKIYEVYNLDKVKNHYQKQKINFDILISDIKLEPIFIGNIDNIEENFKKLSIAKIKINKFKIIDSLEKFIYYNGQLENKIQKEYTQFSKTFQKRNSF